MSGSAEISSPNGGKGIKRIALGLIYSEGVDIGTERMWVPSYRARVTLITNLYSTAIVPFPIPVACEWLNIGEGADRPVVMILVDGQQPEYVGPGRPLTMEIRKRRYDIVIFDDDEAGAKDGSFDEWEAWCKELGCDEAEDLTRSILCSLRKR
jgi:hypothetical protein